MFRIHFDAQTSMWLIQFLKLGLFWMTVKDQSFDKYEEAYDWAVAKGITDVYLLQDAPRNYHRATMIYGTGVR